ncbi:MAG: cobyric acid synthase [Huintestinicola sp.]|uniref:cobyric acid synthase n=1 Tax=Huintestinicola sp. TaxID=2981661 RepID=UPI003EFBDAB2
MALKLMIQGTTSNAGKSFFSAALCRIFYEDGYSCVPFKSQNMALNSYITSEGLEMGRAQAMQAEAACVEPSALMNPILLKPTSDIGSQVIVNGRVRGNMRATEYFRNKKMFIPEIMSAFNELDKKYDIIVIEGAGSPVELNLKADDIVNMGMARLANSPVLLVGDIDRGGVFAQLLGTLMLLEEDERQMVKGLVVNKFRGDKTLFDDGCSILEERGGVPVAGVIPYIDCDIDDEDSLSDKLESRRQGVVSIVVIRLPRISNFTDFDVFSQYDGVSVTYASKPSEIYGADMIIIPGTKSTISDMKWLRESGIEAAVLRMAEKGVPIFGICGGYQMLGEMISDPENTEGGGEIRGMGLLPCVTVFRSEKTRTQITGRMEALTGPLAALSGKGFSGYEIHMGETMVKGNALSRFENGISDGCNVKNIYGSYVHGIFDSSEVSFETVKCLFDAKGMTFGAKAMSRNEYKERQYRLLADRVRENIDMELIYKILRNGI